MSSTTASLPEPRRETGFLIALVAVSVVATGFSYPPLFWAAVGAGFLVFAAVETWLAFLLLIFTLPINFYADLGIAVRDVSALTRLALFLIVAVRFPKRMFRFPKLWIVLMASYVAITLVTSFRAGASDFSNRAIFRLAAQMGFAMCAFALIDSKKRLRQFAAAVALSILLIVTFSAVQVMGGGYTDLFFALNTDPDTVLDWSGRAPSFFDHFNVAAGFLNLCIPYALLLRTEAWKRWALLGVGMLGVVFTQSRGGLIGSVAMLLAMAALLPESRRQKIKAVAAALTVAAVFVALAVLLIKRLGEADANTDTWRLVYALLALKMWSSAPLLGVGFAHFRLFKLDYIPMAAAVDDTHNMYLQVLAETGLAGFVTFFGLVFSATWKALRMQTLEGKVIFIAMLGALVHGLLDTFFLQNPQFGYIFFLQIAIVAVIAQLRADPSTSAASR